MEDCALTRLRLALLLVILVASSADAQGPGFYIAAPGTQLTSCNGITNPFANRTWCADGNTLSWKVYNGSTFVTGGIGGVTSFNNLTGAVLLQGTTSQVQLTTVGNTVTLGTPQNIATTSSPTFNAMTLNGLLTLNAGAIVQHDQYYKSLSSAAATKNLLGINTSDPNSSQLGSNVVTVGTDLPIRFWTGAPKPMLIGRNTGSRYPTYNPGAAMVNIFGEFDPTQTDTNFSGSPGDLNNIGLNVQMTIRPANGWSTGINSLAILGQYLSGEAQTATTGKHNIITTFIDGMPIQINGSATLGTVAAMWIENVYTPSVTDAGPFGEPARYVILQPPSGNPNRFDDVSYFNGGIYTSNVIAHVPGPIGLNPQAGNPLNLIASAATAGSAAGAAAGGPVAITAGNAARTTSGSADGGGITMTVGTGVGTGVSGSVLPGADSTIFGNSAKRWIISAVTVAAYMAASDDQPYARFNNNGGDVRIEMGPGGASTPDISFTRTGSKDVTWDSFGSALSSVNIRSAILKMQGLTTGSASGKKIVCADPADNNRIYISSSDVQCLN